MKYLNHKVTEDPAAVENLFCIPFSKLKQHEMDSHTSEMFLKLCLASKSTESLPDIPEKEKPFILLMTERAVEGRFSFEVCDSTLTTFIALLCKNPGMVIMYLTYLQYECKKRNKPVLDWDEFAMIFASGFPSDQDLHNLWDNTKVKRDPKTGGADNLLDYQSAMESIHFETTEA